METKITVENGIKELVIRQGDAEKIQLPKIINITGTIASPAEYLLKRKSELVAKNCHVIFSYIKMYIKLIVDESNHYSATITGQTELNPDLKKFGINETRLFTIKELKQFLKFNRIFFAEIDANMKMITNLERFSASVQTQIDAHSNDRGDKKQSLEVKIDSNLDLNFVLNMPIFTGESASKFQVEVCCDIRDGATSIWLESPELQSLIITGREALIKKNIEPFKSEFVVIEQ